MPADLQRLNLVRAEVRLELALAKDGKAPTEFRLFKFGPNATENGVVILDEEGARSAMAWVEKYQNKLHINYNHCGRSASFFGPLDPAEAYKAAGWFQLGRRDDGLWAEQVSWTQKGREKVEAREFLYTSPEAWLEPETNRLAAIDGCAITNTPATHGLVPLIAGRAGAPAPPAGGSPQQGDHAMPIELKALLNHALLSADTTEGDALGRIGDNARAARALLSVTGAKTLDEAVGIVDGWKAAAAERDRLREDFARQDGEAVGTRMRAALEAASKADDKGRLKLTPAEKAWAEKEYGLDDPKKPPTKAHEERLTGYLSTKSYATASALTPPPPNGQQSPGSPPAGNGAGVERATYDGKVWADLPHKVLHQLYGSNRPLYDQLKADHEKATGVRL